MSHRKLVADADNLVGDVPQALPDGTHIAHLESLVGRTGYLFQIALELLVVRHVTTTQAQRVCRKGKPLDPHLRNPLAHRVKILLVCGVVPIHHQ